MPNTQIEFAQHDRNRSSTTAASVRNNDKECDFKQSCVLICNFVADPKSMTQKQLQCGGSAAIPSQTKNAQQRNKEYQLKVVRYTRTTRKLDLHDDPAKFVVTLNENERQ